MDLVITFTHYPHITDVTIYIVITLIRYRTIHICWTHYTGCSTYTPVTLPTYVTIYVGLLHSVTLFYLLQTSYGYIPHVVATGPAITCNYSTPHIGCYSRFPHCYYTR